MVSFKRSSQGKDPVPRRRRVVQDDDQDVSAFTANQYRRNQTLSSYRHNTPDESARQKAHHLAYQRRRVGGIFSIVAVAVILLLLLLWQLIAQVSITTSTKQLSANFKGEQYEHLVNNYLMVNPAQRLKFALDEGALSAHVASEAAEVERVEMSGSAGIAQATMTVTFREPVAGWQINGKQYYVDTNGVVFEKNYYAQPKVQIVDESGVTPGQEGGAVVGSRLLGFLGRVVAQAQGRGYTVTKAVLPVDTTRQVDVHFKDTATRIKFSIDRGAGEQVEDAVRSLQYLKTKHIKAQYIDVRVAGRAAYR